MIRTHGRSSDASPPLGDLSSCPPLSNLPTNSLYIIIIISSLKREALRMLEYTAVHLQNNNMNQGAIIIMEQSLALKRKTFGVKR